MSIISPESKVYRIILGKHKGRSCVVISKGDQITDSVKVVFDDSNRNEVGFIKRGFLVEWHVPGWEKVSRERPYGLKEYLRYRSGDGSCALRTNNLAQPQVLEKGDILATGEVVMENPRQGFNGSTLVHLDKSGWVELADRFPIALQGNKKFRLPAELIWGDKLATSCRVVKKPTSIRNNWVLICLDRESCCLDIPYCVPLALE